MELDNAVDEEELNKKGTWVPVTPAKQSSTSINNGIDSHLGLAKTAQFSQNFQNPHAMASEKEIRGSDRGIGYLNSVYSGSDHDFAGLHGTSAKATSECKIGEISGNNRPYKEKINVGARGESQNENAQTAFGIDSTVTSTIPENRSSKKRGNSGIDLDEKPRKRQKMKRHRPKIWDESKPRKTPKSRIEPSTPKPKTPRRRIPTSSTHKRYVSKDSCKVDASVHADGQAANRSSVCGEKPCKRVLRFNLENHVINQKDVKEAAIFTDEHNHYESKDDEFLGFSTQNFNKQAIYPNSNCAKKSCIIIANEKSKIQTRDSLGAMNRQAANLNTECGSSCKESLNFAFSWPLVDGNGEPNIVYAYHRRNKSLSTFLCKLDSNLNLEPQDFDNCFGLGNIVHEYNKSREKRLHKYAYSRETNANLETENQNMCDEMKIEPEVESLQVYRRILKPNECLKNSRKLGPNCPRIYKQTRTQRRKVTTSGGFWNAKTADQCQRSKKGVTLSYGAYKTTKKTRKQSNSRRLTQKEAPERDKCAKRSSESAISKCNFPEQLGHQGTILQNGKQKRKTKKVPESFRCVLNFCLNWGHRRKRSKRLNQRRKLASSVVPFVMARQIKAVVHPEFLGYLPVVAMSYHDNIRQCPSQCKNGLIQIPVGYQKQEDVMLKKVQYQENVALHFGGRHQVPKCVLPIKYDNARMQAVLESVIHCLECLQISNECNQLVVQDKKIHGELIPYKRKCDPLKTRKPPAKVDFDKQTLIAWKQLMENDGSGATEEVEKDSVKWWEDVRKMYRERVNSLIARMHLIQGDRRFSRWKGTIVDSIIGVFLTQNVTDCSSSSAFMSLVASFPPVLKDTNCKENIVCGQKSIGSIIKEPVIAKNKEEAYVYPTEQDMGYQYAEIRESHICSTRETVLGSMEDEVIVKDAVQGFPDASCDQNLTNISASCSTDKSTTYRKYLKLEEINNLKQFYGHQEGKISCQENFEELQGKKDMFSSDTPSLNGTHALHSSASFPQFDDNLNFVHHLGYSRDGRMKKLSDINNLDHRNYFESETVILVEDTQRIQDPIIAEMSSSSKLDEYHNGNKMLSRSESTSGRKKGKVEPETPVDWDELRKTYSDGRSRDTTGPTDSANWEAVREAPVKEVAKVIEARGMNNILAGRIKDFLDRIVKDHGSIDLEWLRNVPPEKAREYLLSIPGLGLKSVECVRLLTLHHVAFPVDTNVGRIVVRLGWVPLQPLPEDVQIHLLNQYPMVDAIQKYLWPRLCTLDQQTLYELHYQLITFGKVFCTKKKPNCNACPMRGECRHFASAFARFVSD
ncbi:demeter-like 1 [Olea europaea subsp. europaea]|uniref:Demeter-like 1 n=1 Tax=Olea europaea subsp. europaea TaxID=158383 RepID=A0A8S0SPQ2_OLEEU|nr:demeter-like 1 [Olea europaea subsp. europaea]